MLIDKGHTGGVKAIVAVNDGLIASGSIDTSIKIWNVMENKLSAELLGHSNVVSCLHTLADGSLVSGSWDKTVKVWVSSFYQNSTTVAAALLLIEVKFH